LAPYAWNTIKLLVIDPIAYYWWGIKQVVRAVPQAAYWYFIIIILGIISLLRLLKYVAFPRIDREDKYIRGPVQTLSESISRVEKSNYFRWAVANQLAKLTLKILKDNQGSTIKTSETKNRNCSEINWSPQEDVQSYLEAGIRPFERKSSSDRRFLQNKTIDKRFDVDLNKIVDYIEMLVEGQSDR
jgi:hypothetical protein